jgi:uncharacterized protein YggT (Ycf19 family)
MRTFNMKYLRPIRWRLLLLPLWGVAFFPLVTITVLSIGSLDGWNLWLDGMDYLTYEGE